MRAILKKYLEKPSEEVRKQLTSEEQRHADRVKKSKDKGKK
tara:strand:+ start:77 stop:199 length:123 start_codon:yes stop_codon:yes gene_type:complete